MFAQLLCNHFSKNQNYSFKATDYHKGGSGRIAFSLFPEVEFLSEHAGLNPHVKRFYNEWGKDALPWFGYSIDANGAVTS